MKKKGLMLVSGLIITAISLGGYTFAQGIDQELVNNQPRVEIKQSLEKEEYNNSQWGVISEESVRPRSYNSHCWNDEDMIRMHNSMIGGNRFNGSRGMMGRFQ